MVANNGRETLAALDKERFDAVLMDVEMPEMDGYEATAAIRANERGTGQHIPILAMTAHAMKGAREQCLKQAWTAMYPNPCIPGLLLMRSRPWCQSMGRARMNSPPLNRQRRCWTGRYSWTVWEVMRSCCAAGHGVPWRLSDFGREDSRRHRPRRCSSASFNRPYPQGCGGHLWGVAPYEAAGDLENLGRAGDLTQAPAIFVTLESELHWLQSALAALLSCGLQCQHGSLQRD